MRWVGSFLAGMTVLFFAMPVSALSPVVIDPTVELDADKKILVSSLYTKRGEAFVELYNNTERPIDVTGTVIRFSSSTAESDVTLPTGWLLADAFVTLSEGGIVSNVINFPLLELPPTEAITYVQVLGADGGIISEASGFPSDATSKWYQRKASGMSGIFTNDFSAATASTRLRHTPLYILPAERPLLRIVEIYPHASNCAPTDSSVLCGDYVKLYNPSDTPARTADYRLRSDSASSESSNAFHLDAYEDVAPGEYLTVSLRDDGGTLSLTDDGGWLWLEDSAGIVRYEETVASYPSASSVTKVGQAWALADDGSWQWTSTPMPGLSNVFPAPSDPGMGSGVLAEVVDCPQGKYRNPETNRCRNIEEAIATLVTCAEGQSRNPETNRCRSVASAASAVLAPCGPDQERNSATNRCRSVLSATGPTPCPAGQTRNLETKRCRKSVLTSLALPAAIEPVKQQTTNPFVMTLLGTIGVGAIGYGIYEWRSEIAGSLRKVLARVSKT